MGIYISYTLSYLYSWIPYLFLNKINSGNNLNGIYIILFKLLFIFPIFLLNYIKNKKCKIIYIKKLVYLCFIFGTISYILTFCFYYTFLLLLNDAVKNIDMDSIEKTKIIEYNKDLKFNISEYVFDLTGFIDHILEYSKIYYTSCFLYNIKTSKIKY